MTLALQGDSEQGPEASDDAAYDATTDEEGEAPANPEISDCAISRQINSVLIT